jgi:hypothetical protein
LCRSSELLQAILAEIDERELSCGIACAVHDLFQHLESDQTVKQSAANAYVLETPAPSPKIPSQQQPSAENNLGLPRTNDESSRVDALQNITLEQCSIHASASPFEDPCLQVPPNSMVPDFNPVPQSKKSYHKPKETEMVGDVQARALEAFKEERRQIAHARLAVLHVPSQRCSTSPRWGGEHRGFCSSSLQKKQAVPMFRKSHAKKQQIHNVATPPCADRDMGTPSGNKDITNLPFQGSYTVCKNGETKFEGPSHVHSTGQKPTVQAEDHVPAGHTAVSKSNAASPVLPKEQVELDCTSQCEGSSSDTEDACIARDDLQQCLGEDATSGDSRNNTSDFGVQCLHCCASTATGSSSLADEKKVAAGDCLVSSSRKFDGDSVDVGGHVRLSIVSKAWEQGQQEGSVPGVGGFPDSSDESTESYCSEDISQHDVSVPETLDDPFSGANPYVGPRP